MSVILIVEDEIFIRQSAEGIIEDLGHVALAADGLGEAIVHLAAPRLIDALFVDIRLKTLARGGYDIADQGILIQPGMRVLYTSGTPLTPAMTGLHGTILACWASGWNGRRRGCRQRPWPAMPRGGW